MPRFFAGQQERRRAGRESLRFGISQKDARLFLPPRMESLRRALDALVNRQPIRVVVVGREFLWSLFFFS